VGNVGDEIAAGFFHALGFGEVAEHGDGASTGQGRGGHVEGAAGNDGRGAGGLDFVGGGGFLDGGQEIGIANGFDHGLLQASALRNQAIHGRLAHCTRPSSLTAMTASCMLLSRVSSWRWLETTAAKLCSTRRAVLSMAAATRPISS
jgi:hypothetical protein